MTIGIYSLTGLGNEMSGGWIEARQFNATFIAALLTIIGFSINDTIVIFDRIREDLKLGIPPRSGAAQPRAEPDAEPDDHHRARYSFRDDCAFYLFGGGAVNDFAFTFLVGISPELTSSIYIASALVLCGTKESARCWERGFR